MINIFRKIRQNLLKKNKFTHYLIYAAGEIALVMIGILLALQVNNWNEKRKLKSTIENTLKTISYDLEIDTTYASTIIKFYETNQKNSQKVITGEINENNYKDCLECFSLVTIYQPFTIQSKGIGQLKNIISTQTTEKDSLLNDITKFYSVFSPLIDKSNDRMETVVMKNFNDFQEKSWFIDMATGNFSDDMVEYFTKSEDYKKRIASHAILAVGNHLGIARRYKNDAIDLLNQIDKRLNQNLN
jgi:hypothetical protein